MSALQPQLQMMPPAVSPLREVWTIAWPTVLAMTSYTIMQFTDQLMVGQVGPDELAAQSNGSMWSWTALSFALGILTVVNTFVSQNLGAGTPRNGPKYAWGAVWLGVSFRAGRELRPLASKARRCPPPSPGRSNAAFP